jgi:hypothetical protein
MPAATSAPITAVPATRSTADDAEPDLGVLLAGTGT